MDSQSISTSTNYQQVTVDVPEDRVAEFHAFFARFLAWSGRSGSGRGRRHGRPYGRRHGGTHRGRCAGRHEEAQQSEASEATEVTEAQGGATQL